MIVAQGIVMQAETETFLTQYAGLKPEQTGVWLKYRQYLNCEGAPESYQEVPQLMTSWGLIGCCGGPNNRIIRIILRKHSSGLISPKAAT